jgi:XTP/dITP diphosphohydrolase
MKPILVATTNRAKLAEYRILLASYALDPISLVDAGIREHPEENAATFAGNALLKAHFYYARAGIATIADDGGLEIDALGGEPGVRSHRWLGDAADNSDAALVAEVMRRMEDVEDSRRTARLRAAAALTWRDGLDMCERVVEGTLEGVIARRPFREIQPGFPYRAVLYLPDRKCYLGELGENRAAQISQRRKTVELLGDELRRIAGL